MLVHRFPRPARPRVFDFFVGRSPRPRARQEGISPRWIAWTSTLAAASTQVFHIGRRLVRGPGVPAVRASRKHTRSARLHFPWRDPLFSPAIALAPGAAFELQQNGQAYLHRIPRSDPAPLRPSSPRRVREGKAASVLVAEDRLFQKDLAGTLELIAEQGGQGSPTKASFADAISKHLRRPGRLHHENEISRNTVSSADDPSRATFCKEEYPLESTAVGRRES